MSSKLFSSHTNPEAVNEFFSEGYFSLSAIIRINEFYEAVPDIVDDKKEFVSHSLTLFNKQILDESRLEAYLNQIIKITELTEKNIKSIGKKLLTGRGVLKVKNVDCSSKVDKALVVFTDSSKILFEPCSLENEELINKFILLLNNKLAKEHRLVIRKTLNYFRYGFSAFIEPLECSCAKHINDYYFKAGELLAVMYILNLHSVKSSNIIDMYHHPLLQGLQDVFNLSAEVINCSPSSKDISKDILNSSVYNLEFLPESKGDLNEVHRAYVKSGFEYMYSILIDNKLEIIEYLKELFEKNPICLRRIIPKLYSLNEGDLRRQLYFIDIRFLKNRDEKTASVFSSNETPCSVEKKYFLQLATSLGDHIIQKGIIGYENLTTSRTWISTIIHDNADKYSSLNSSNYNLYDGDSGIALFLLYLGVVTKKVHFRNIALEAVQNSIEHINNLDKDINASCGIFKGVSGELYTFSKIYTVTKNDSIKVVLEKSIVYMQKLLKKNRTVNVAEGASGILALLLSMYNDIDFLELKNKMLDLSFDTCENIVDNIQLESCEPGFVYGIDGVLAFLAGLMTLTENKEVEATIERMLSFEREKYREVLKSQGSWNKGASGILLSRLMLKEAQYKDELIDTEIRELLECTIKNGFGNSPYYYNGDIGTVEILEYAADVLGDTALKNRCAHTFNTLAREVIEPLIEREISHGDKSTALFTGILGLGYSLLRKCDEGLVPQVLRIQ